MNKFVLLLAGIAMALPALAQEQEPFATQAALWCSSVVDVHNSDGKAGSGFIIGEEGGRLFIATAAHVVEDAAEVTLIFPGVAEPVQAEVYKQNKHYDVAILKASAKGIQWRAIPYVLNPSVADQVFLINTRMNNREILSANGTAKITSLDAEELECSVGVRAGNSGTALFSADGLVGMILQDPGIARPVKLVKELAEEWEVPWGLPGISADRTVVENKAPTADKRQAVSIAFIQEEDTSVWAPQAHDGNISTWYEVRGNGVLIVSLSELSTFDRIKFYHPFDGKGGGVPWGHIFLPASKRKLRFTTLQSPVMQREGNGAWEVLDMKKYCREKEIHIVYRIGKDSKDVPIPFRLYEIVVEGPARQ